MTDTPVVAPRRFSIASIGRYLLLLVIALVLLVAGFLGRGFVPANWLQKIQIGSFRLFPAAPEISQVVVSPTKTADPMAGMDHSSMGTSMPELTVTPFVPATSASGVVTVLTLTPTPAIAVPTQESITATAIPQTATPLPTATTQPTKSVPPTIDPLEVSVEMISLELEDLHRILETTTTMAETFRRGQPTEAELTALRAQLYVIDQRMARLAVEFQLAEANGETEILLGQSSDLLNLMRQANGIVQSVLAGPTVDRVILNQAQGILEQLVAMVEQLQDLVTTVQETVRSTPVPATPTLVATATAIPAQTATPAAVSSNQLDQMEIMLSQMIERLGAMQSALDQKQAQPGTTVP